MILILSRLFICFSTISLTAEKQIHNLSWVWCNKNCIAHVDNFLVTRITNPQFCVFVCLAQYQYSNFHCVGRPLSLPRVKGRLDLWPFCHRSGLRQASYTLRALRMKLLSCSQGPSLLCSASVTFDHFLTWWFPKLLGRFQKRCRVKTHNFAQFNELLELMLQSRQSKYFEFPVTHYQSGRFFSQ